MPLNMHTGYAVIYLCLATAPFTYAGSRFNIKDTYIGNDFLGAFKWETLDDPTHGRVNFVDQSTALGSNLTWGMLHLLSLDNTTVLTRKLASKDKFVMRADNTKTVPASARGRDSIRIQSMKSYDDSVMVLDLSHMPEGCATWPAFWTISQAGPWPHGGEIDIIEGKQ